MKAIVIGLAGVLALSACGVDGKPLPPKVTATQSIGFSSTEGPISNTTLSFKFGG